MRAYLPMNFIYQTLISIIMSFHGLPYIIFLTFVFVFRDFFVLVLTSWLVCRLSFLTIHLSMDFHFSYFLLEASSPLYQSFLFFSLRNIRERFFFVVSPIYSSYQSPSPPSFSDMERLCCSGGALPTSQRTFQVF